MSSNSEISQFFRNNFFLGMRFYFKRGGIAVLLLFYSSSGFSNCLPKQEKKAASSLDKLILVERSLEGFSSFLDSQLVIKLPYKASGSSIGTAGGESYFCLDYDKGYYDLVGLKSLGKITENDGFVFILFGYELVGKGEGFSRNMKTLMAYSKEGIFMDSITLTGEEGGEGHVTRYEGFIATDLSIVRKVTSVELESSNGLGHAVVDSEKTEFYKFYNKKFREI
ncbi:hypothetical protein ACRS5L_22115 [Metapseudomonas otitidis]|uniref:hypothetical protein n=1 Tax=Metapseudomonas otitidis TaxID=319939 RepID=UPI003EE24EFE